MAVASPIGEHRYNDDLLASTVDQKAIQIQYPELFHVLDHPELREQFAIYNGLANGAKSKVHRLGLVAIGLAAVALLSSATAPVLSGIIELKDLDPVLLAQIETVKKFSVYFEIAGLAGAAIAIGGLWIATWKKTWLESRLMTERLRGWHFQLLMHRGKEVEDSCSDSDPQAIADFQAKRAQWFSAFMHQHEGTQDSILHDLIEAPEARYTPLHESTSEYTPGSHVIDRVFEAYRTLRLKHQAHYTAHKLQRTTDQPLWKPHKWPINVLNSRLGSITSTCLVGALAVSFYMVAAHFMHWPMAHSVALPAVILCFLVLNVSTRGVLDGLAVREEAQRYTDYAGEVRYLLTKFESVHEREARMRIMQDMERAAVEEMKGFLRSHMEAKFIV
jgi:hypothetical protein